MGTVPIPGTQSSGVVITSTLLNGYRDVMNFWASPPQCLAYHSSTISLTNSTTTVIPLQSEAFDVVPVRRRHRTRQHDEQLPNPHPYQRQV